MLVLRTLLFVPGNQERRIEKAQTIPADAFILDMEDSVPLSEKGTARSNIVGSVERLAATLRPVFVRVNSLQTPNAVEDIKAAVNGKSNGICLPKSESAATIRQAQEIMADAEKTSGIEIGKTVLLPLVETPRGIINATEIASASPRVIGIAFGAEDFVLEMEITRTREGTEIYYPRMVLATACHAVNILAIDTVYTDIRDREGLIAETKYVKQLGFQGKMVIHPDQVIPVNEVFSPSETEVAYARRVVDAFDAGLKRGEASVSLDGKMIDIPVAERARLLLARAEALASMEKH